MGRLLAVLGGLAWFGVMATIALAIRWSEPPPRVVPRDSTLPPLLVRLNAARPASSSEGESWVVTRATSAHNILVVQVRATVPSEARTIATYLVETVADRNYDEILVYVWATKSRQFPDRRIQWTRSGGYTELMIDDQ